MAAMIKNILITVFLIFVAAAVTTPAQFNPEKSVSAAQDQFFDIKKRSVELERMKREANKISEPRDASLKFPEIKEDFEEMQRLNDKVVELSEASSQINNGDVLKLVSEIHHRAERLKSNLFLADPKTKKEKESKLQGSDKPQDTKALIRALDKSINTFVHSPIFQNINIVNLSDSLQAQKDLESVIRISSEIKTQIKE